MNSSKSIRKRWRHWLERLEPEITELQVSRHLFEEIREIIAANKKIQGPDDVHRWLFRNYAHTAAVGIRKMTDADKRSISLSRLLEEIEAHHTAVTRETCVSWYPKRIRRAGHSFFDEVAGNGRDILPASVPARDRRHLARAEKRNRIFVNKSVAHLDRRNLRRKLPKFNELHATIDLVEELFRKYKLLLAGACADPLLPHWTSD